MYSSDFARALLTWPNLMCGLHLRQPVIAERSQAMACVHSACNAMLPGMPHPAAARNGCVHVYKCWWHYII